MILNLSSEYLKPNSNHLILINQILIQPIPQIGPTCGMVALMMAIQIYKAPPTLNQILEKGKELQLSKNGEIFSIYNLKTLASFYLDCSLEIKDTQDGQSYDNNFINELMNNNLIIMPYDNDKDHRPCLKNGHKSHWALINGLVIILHKDKINNDFLLEYFIQDIQLCNVYFKKSEINLEIGDILQTMDDLYVIALHGKSKNNAIWNYKDFVKSNQNLIEIDHNQRAKLNFETDLILDLKQSLANKYLLLK
ncbi:unnamed protein product [Gordionus sp. m RMFG-2023]|uniref:actin maturation protease-like n=1 Tax=Gordionus sp. m RMFG-2023 TaxID=3053472 RepID=UPI0030DF7B6A